MDSKYMKSKNVIVIVMLVLIGIMTVGFAVFATNLTINGTASITSTWKVVFTNIEEVSKTSGVTIKDVPTASGTTATFNVGLSNPGDKIEYRITVENQGTLDAIIDNITASETGSDAIKFEITNIKIGDSLLAKSSTTFNVTISYDESITSQPNITTNALTVDISYVQEIGQNITPGDPVIDSSTTLARAILRDNSARQADVDELENLTAGLYYTSKNTEDNKTTYYYHGAVENNYVEFGTTGTCSYNGVDIPGIGADNFVYNMTESSCTANNVCSVGYGKPLLGAEYIAGIDEETCKSSFDSWVLENNLSNTCVYRGVPISFIDENGNRQSDFSETECTSTNVCLVTVNDMFYDGMVGVTGSECTSYGGILTEEKATYYANGFNPYLNQKATYTPKENTVWRITRINEDGSVRLVANTSIGTSIFNTYNNDNAYVGYMYGTSGSSTYADTHKNTNESEIKKFLDTWYKINLNNYTNMFSTEAGFCNDRSLFNGLGYGIENTSYGAFGRWSSESMQFACPQSNDLFTPKTSSKGNKELTYPIGLLSADELMYYGVGLDINNKYWTLSPLYYTTDAGNFAPTNMTIQTGTIEVNSSATVYPVINLKSDVEITKGNGTINNPYVIKTN